MFRAVDQGEAGEQRLVDDAPVRSGPFLVRERKKAGAFAGTGAWMAGLAMEHLPSRPSLDHKFGGRITVGKTGEHAQRVRGAITPPPGASTGRQTPVERRAAAPEMLSALGEGEPGASSWRPQATFLSNGASWIWDWRCCTGRLPGSRADEP